jgi:hypothetical protein
MKVIKESIKLYTQKIESILLLSFTVILPFLLLHSLASNAAYISYGSTPYSFMADLLNLFMMLLFYMVIQIPFIQLVLTEMEGTERPLRQIYGVFLEYGFSLFLFGAVYAFLVLLGMSFFVIPGILAAIFLFLTPYITIFSKRTPRFSWKVSIRLGKKHFLKIFMIILLSSLFEWCVTVLLFNVILTVTTSYLAILLTQILLNMLILPFVVIVTTLLVRTWHEELVFAAK